MEFNNPIDVLTYVKEHNQKAYREYRIKTNDKTGIQYREYYYKIA
jgi:hypothetical protein